MFPKPEQIARNILLIWWNNDGSPRASGFWIKGALMRALFPTISIFCLLTGKGLAAAENCEASHWNWGHERTVAESREEHVPAAQSTIIDPGPNGGIRIHGWNNQDVLVKACIHASDTTEQDAQALLKQVKIVRGPGDLRPDGPSGSNSRHWGVSYEVWMPDKSNVEAHAINGGIAIESLEGQIRFHTQNGGVSLIGLAGDVDGSTQNGGVTVTLNGSTWRGTGLNVKTQNGSVNLRVPDRYSAQVEASTVNGGMHVDFPVQVSGKTLSFNLGSGGPILRTTTVNGGVSITKS
jgi:archaellum component FlaG (FlaF/FlaG flagellin family)